MKAHPFAEIVPPMSRDDYGTLSTDIAKNGLLEPITIYQGMVLDGRNRDSICHGLGIEVKTVEFKPREDLLKFYSADEQALRFVISKNLARRHLDTGQKAMVATEMLPHLEAIAKARHAEGSRKGGRANGKVLVNLPEPSKSDTNPVHAPTSRDQAAAAVGVSPSSVQTAKNIATKAPDLAEQVKAGTTTLNAASKQLADRNGETKKPRKPKSYSFDVLCKAFDKLVDQCPIEDDVKFRVHIQEKLDCKARNSQ